ENQFLTDLRTQTCRSYPDRYPLDIEKPKHHSQHRYEHGIPCRPTAACTARLDRRRRHRYSEPPSSTSAPFTRLGLLAEMVTVIMLCTALPRVSANALRITSKTAPPRPYRCVQKWRPTTF